MYKYLLIIMSIFMVACKGPDWEADYRGVHIEAWNCDFNKEYLLPRAVEAIDELANEFGEPYLGGINLFYHTTGQSSTFCNGPIGGGCETHMGEAVVRCRYDGWPFFFDHKETTALILLHVILDRNDGTGIGWVDNANKCHTDSSYDNLGLSCVVEHPVMFRYNCGDGAADGCVSEWESRDICKYTYKGQSVCTKKI